MSNKSVKGIGLRNIPVANTKISYIDGSKGKLIYRGFDINDLAQNSTYEEVAYLLIYGTLPNSSQLEEFLAKLNYERVLPKELVDSMKNLPKKTSTMDVLQGVVSLLSGYDDELQSDSLVENQKKAIKLVGKFPTIIASWYRIKENLPLVAPNKTLSHAANFLYMLQGKKPDTEIGKIFDICLILHAEHSFNASTFTARVVASTKAHMYSSVSAAIGALSGELHGGANAKVMKNLLEINDPSRVEEWVVQQLDDNKRIMGMGHAVYKTTDPRALILKKMSEKLAQRTQTKWYEITNKIEETTKAEFKRRKGREIFANVDLYSPSVYYVMGIPPDLFTPIFALSRVPGWAANIIEEKFPEPPTKPTLYRPLAEYVGNYCGPVDCKYVPLNMRNK